MGMISRFEGIINNMHEYNYHVLGCGAIGSSAAIQLTRMGAENIHLYDFDTVEIQNIGVSQYGHSHLDMNKVDALKAILLDINPDILIKTNNCRFDGYEEYQNDIIILGFDSMASRLEAIEIIANIMKAKPFLVIDGRMGAEQYQQYAFENLTVNKYKKNWYSDEEGDPEPCSMKATSYCSNMAGSFIVNTIRKVLTKQPYNRKFYFSFPIMKLGIK